jgi:hypothetical protein
LFCRHPLESGFPRVEDVVPDARFSLPSLVPLFSFLFFLEERVIIRRVFGSTKDSGKFNQATFRQLGLISSLMTVDISNR